MTLQDIIGSPSDEEQIPAWVGIPHGFIAVARRGHGTDAIELIADGGTVLASLTKDDALDVVRVIHDHYLLPAPRLR